MIDLKQALLFEEPLNKIKWSHRVSLNHYDILELELEDGSRHSIDNFNLMSYDDLLAFLKDNLKCSTVYEIKNIKWFSKCVLQRRLISDEPVYAGYVQEDGELRLINNVGEALLIVMINDGKPSSLSKGYIKAVAEQYCKDGLKWMY